MITYFQQAIQLLLGIEFYEDYTWSYAFENIAIFFFAIIILVAAFKLFKFLVFGWWR